MEAAGICRSRFSTHAAAAAWQPLDKMPTLPQGLRRTSGGRDKGSYSGGWKTSSESVVNFVGIRSTLADGRRRGADWTLRSSEEGAADSQGGQARPERRAPPC